MATNITSQKKEISKTYFPNPFHNWDHGRWVGDITMILEGSKGRVSPGRMAGYIHDSDHKGFVQPDDEERAAEIADRMLTDWGYQRGFIDLTKIKILGTIFAHRGYDLRPEQISIADADLSKLGGEYTEFTKNSIRFLLEEHPKGEISDEKIIDFFKNEQPKFFNYLTSISQKPETIFLSKEAQIYYPDFSRNKDFMAREIEIYPDSLIRQVRAMEQNPHVMKFRNAS